jgi:hypothetical protein
MRTYKLVAAVLLSLTCLSIAIWGQGSFSSLRGTISDPKGAMIPGASVTISNPATGFSRSAKTDSQGAYQFPDVPPSTYSVTVQAPGFAELKQANVQLLVNTPATLNLQVQVAGATTTVEVTGAAPLVNTQDASLGHAFDSNQLVNLPSADRDPVSILSLQPGVVYFNKDAVDPNNDSRNGAVNGARSDQTNVTYDGMDNNDQLRGLAFTGVLRATLDSLQEFRVTTSNSNADAGRSSGAQVSLVTKSGTNAFHGSLYEYHRPTFTTANDWFNKQAELGAGLPNIPPKVLRNTFGGSVGGPIKKDRTFFFFSYEGFRSAETQQVTREIPTLSLRQGFLKYLCDTSLPNCTVGNPVVNVQNVPGLGLVATLTPAQVASLDTNCGTNCPLGGGPNPLVANINGSNPGAVFNQYPLPNTNSVGDTLNTAGITFAAPIPTHYNTYILKLDHKITANGNHSIFIRGNLQNDHLVHAEGCPPVTDSACPQFPGSPASQASAGNSKGLTAGYTAVLSSNLINNLRYGYVRQGNNDAGLGIANQNFNHFRGFDNILPFGARSLFYTVPVHNFINDTTWTKGRHTIQFGTNWRLIHNNRQSNEENYSEGITNLFWLSPSFISGNGDCRPDCTSLDPAINLGSGFPAVDPNFGSSYDFSAMAVAGILSEVETYQNQDKNGNLLPNGSLIRRNFKNFEAEFYVQDAFRVKPNLTLTLGLRYSLLQPPYEANGEQAAPTIDMDQWFKTRGTAMLSGQTIQPDLTFDLAGQANGKKPYWAWDYGDIAPRFAFAYSPNFEDGMLRHLFGGPGKTSIRGGYGIYYDHFGMGIVNTFDRNGTYGLTSFLSNPAGTLSVDTAPRFTSLNAVPATLLPQPAGKFPFTPSNDPNTFGLAIAWGLDDHLKTPYSHVFDLSVQRDLGHNFVLETTYTGRLGRRLMQEVDLAQPLNLVDPKSGVDYFTAASTFSRLAYAGTPVNAVGNIPYWQNMFPLAAGPASSVSYGCGFPGESALANYTATQAMYDEFACNLFNETLALEIADAFCFPACAGPNGTPFRYYQDQFSSLYAWKSQGTSAYHGVQVSLRHAMTNGLQFDLNYVFSKSLDVGSNAERVNGFEASGGVAFNDQVINAWSPRQWYAVSDFDLTHQINANWVYDLPVGHGRKFAGGMSGITQALFGGWGLSGIFRWTSGFPFTVLAAEGWATNFELNGSSVQVGPKPKTGTFFDSSGNPVAFDPKQFPTPTDLGNEWRGPFPGESGQRNNYRGPGFFEVDTGVSKTWDIKETQHLQFRWEVFNATNSVRFDAANSIANEDIADIGGFGKYSSTLTKPRVMQFSLRYEF